MVLMLFLDVQMLKKGTNDIFRCSEPTNKVQLMFLDVKNSK